MGGGRIGGPESKVMLADIWVGGGWGGVGQVGWQFFVLVNFVIPDYSDLGAGSDGIRKCWFTMFSVFQEITGWHSEVFDHTSA